MVRVALTVLALMSSYHTTVAAYKNLISLPQLFSHAELSLL